MDVTAQQKKDSESPDEPGLPKILPRPPLNVRAMRIKAITLLRAVQSHVPRRNMDFRTFTGALIYVFRLVRPELTGFLSAILDPLVVVTMMTTLALIVSILAYSKLSFFQDTKPGGQALLLCVITGTVGGVAVAAQLARILKRRYVCDKLGVFISEGLALKAKCFNNEGPPPDADGWSDRVAEFLHQHLGSAYASRLYSGAGLVQKNVIVAQSRRAAFGTLEIGLARLEQFLSELE